MGGSTLPGLHSMPSPHSTQMNRLPPLPPKPGCGSTPTSPEPALASGPSAVVAATSPDGLSSRRRELCAAVTCAVHGWLHTNPALQVPNVASFAGLHGQPSGTVLALVMSTGQPLGPDGWAPAAARHPLHARSSTASRNTCAFEFFMCLKGEDPRGTAVEVSTPSAVPRALLFRGS
jgi:hypothetical protein